MTPPRSQRGSAASTGFEKAPPPTNVNWRMAYVGTVSVVDGDGEALVTRHYAAPACDDPRASVKMVADLR